MDYFKKNLRKNLELTEKAVSLHQFSHIFGQMGVVVRLYPICFFCFIGVRKLKQIRFSLQENHF